MNRTLQHTLLALETQLLNPATRGDSAAIERLLAVEFLETGVSGAQYGRDAIVAALAAEETAGSPEIQGFRTTLLGPEAALATYTSVMNGTPAHRSSVWIYRESRWQMLHHQGTLARA